MDHYFSRICFGLCFNKVQEIFGLFGINFKTSNWEWKMFSWIFIDQWGSLPYRIFWPLLWRYTFVYLESKVSYLCFSWWVSKDTLDQVWNYLIIDGTLYRRGVDCILRHCLTHKEANIVLNDFHIGACGGHLSGLATSQKTLHDGYLCPSLIKYCIEVVKKCHLCHILSWKMGEHVAPMFMVIFVGPLTNWGIDFTTCHPISPRWNRYIIMEVG